MTVRLLLTALAGERWYKNTITFIRIAAMIGAVAGVVIVLPYLALNLYILGAFWPSLLYTNSFGGGAFSVMGIPNPTLTSIFFMMRFPLDMARVAVAPSDEMAALSLALRRALAARDVALAPHATGWNTRSYGTPEDHLFAPPAITTETLTLNVPAAMITDRTLIILACVGVPFLLALTAPVAVAMSLVLNLPASQPYDLGAIWRSAAVNFEVMALIGAGGLMVALAMFMIVGAARQISHRARERKGQPVTVDALRLRFHQPVWSKRQRHIAWSEARSLALFTYKDNRTLTHTVYLLDSPDQTLLWEEPPAERYVSLAEEQRISEQRDQARQLTRTVIERTGLPLLDLSATVETIVGGPVPQRPLAGSFLNRAYLAALAQGDVELATMLWRMREPFGKRLPKAIRQLTSLSAPGGAQERALSGVTRYARLVSSTSARQDQATLDTARSLASYYPTTEAHDTPATYLRLARRAGAARWLIQTCNLVSLPMIALLLLMGGVFWIGGRESTSMTQALPAQVYRQSPLYTASLRTPQVSWDVYKATKEDPASLAFTSGGYQLSTGDASRLYLASWIPRQVDGDLALASTVTVYGPSATHEEVSAGVLFDAAPDGSAFSMFGINTFGHWWIQRYDSAKNGSELWQIIGGDYSSAIHTGDGATSRILVVRHGALYLFYVNDTLVERYYDQDHALPAGGDIGVYIGAIGATNIVARFTDFALYSVPPQLAAAPSPPALPSWLQWTPADNSSS